MDFLQAITDVHSACLDDIVWLWYTDSLEVDTGLGFDLLDEHLGLSGVEGDACTTCTCASCSATSVDVGLCLFGWLDLYDEVDVRDVKTS